MQFKDEHRKACWVDVILPLAVKQDYSYSVPVDYLDHVKVGARVEVPLRNKHYAGVISRIFTEKPVTPTRPFISLIDEEPIVSETHLKLWRWIAYYYACTVGEVMIVALPSALKLSSETKIILNPYAQKSATPPTKQKKKEYLLHEALQTQEEISISELRKLLEQKNVYQFLKDQINKKHIYVREELTAKYKPKFDDFIRLIAGWMDRGDEAFELVQRSDKQTRVLSKIIELHEDYIWIPKSILYKQIDTNNSVVKALEKKGLIEIVKHQVDRIQVKEEPVIADQRLSESQQVAANQIDNQFETKNVILLQGVTGSGKTQVYIDKIRKVVEAGGQVLYLLPEIALTAQMLGRMQKAFANSVLFFHSRMNSAEQVEVWQKVLQGHPIILGARSSIFLPFRDLSLIIVDEEHDGSYKQQDPTPRYNARDVAVYLSMLYGSKILLGTATPSLESLLNKLDQKYGYVKMTERYGDAQLPTIRIVDLNPDQESKKDKKKDDTIFSEDLLTAIRNRVEAGEQVLLFQNRRGYAPSLRCFKCTWVMGCPNCDVSLTTHKFTNEMRCHYCGFRSGIVKACPTCGNRDVKLIGFGTEKVENVLAEHFPEYKIRRMDHDTMRGKNSYAEVISDMQMGKIDILIGTQMVTKGLDFDNITLVGILHADALFSFPDFRAGEKAFQLLTQVSGRAGRQQSESEVIIQTFDPENWIIEKVLNYDFGSFAAKELQERKAFKYPPFYRLISLTVKHKNRRLNGEASQIVAHYLRKQLGKRILGPVEPAVARINNVYHMSILIKMEKEPARVAEIKQFIQQVILVMKSKKGFSSVRVNVDVDPY